MYKLSVLLSFSIFIFSCSEIKPENFSEDKTLYEYALKLFNHKEYSESIPFFESLKNRFPQSPYVPDSELKIADSNFGKEDYLEAEIHYQSFRALHPLNREIPHVIYRLGLGHLEQSPKSVDRDQSHTQKAISYFTELLTDWPQSKECQEAKQKLDYLKRKLVRKELYVADFYIHQKNYSAALVRLKSLSENSSFEDLEAEAKFKLGISYLNLKKQDEARQAFLEVSKSSKAGEYQKQAAHYLKELSKEDKATPN